MFLPLGAWASGNVLINSALAELFTNLHSFLVIVTNHAGDDMHRFDDAMGNKAEFYRRQVVGSVNFRTGGDFNDFLRIEIAPHPAAQWPGFAPRPISQKNHYVNFRQAVGRGYSGRTWTG